MIKIAIGNDLSGLNYKKEIIKNLSCDYEFVDYGSFNEEICDYPLYAKIVCESVAKKECDYGILICGSGEGMCIVANKIKGIRCGIGYNDDVSRLLREHNDANVIAFGARFMELNDVQKRIKIFINSSFIGKHHEQRIEQIKELEK